MKTKLILLAGVLVLMAALSASDAEIVRNLEFFESMDAIAAEDQATLEKMADAPQDEALSEEEDDEN